MLSINVYFEKMENTLKYKELKNCFENCSPPTQTHNRPNPFSQSNQFLKMYFLDF